MKTTIILLTVLFSLLLLGIVISNNNGTLPDFLYSIYAIPLGDKVGHFILTGLLALLVNLSLSCRKTRIASREILLGSLLVAAVVTVEELTQVFFPNTRSLSLFDLLSGYLGIWFFGRLAERLSSRSQIQEPTP